jgi:MFS family permease
VASTWFGRAFRSLRIPNYRLFAGAELISVTGTWMQIVAENWLVLRLTGSGLALGITTALQFLPLAFAAPYGGLLVDRMNKRRLIAATQTVAGLLALTTGVLTLVGLIRIWMVFAAALALGFVNAVDGPARQAFTQEMVGPEQVANAVALNNSIAMGARAFGPALGGILIASAGLGWAFVANALTYGLVVAALVLMRPGQLFPLERIPRRPGQVREGLRYAATRGSIRTVLVILAVVSIFGSTSRSSYRSSWTRRSGWERRATAS